MANRNQLPVAPAGKKEYSFCSKRRISSALRIPRGIEPCAIRRSWSCPSLSGQRRAVEKQHWRDTLRDEKQRLSFRRSCALERFTPDGALISIGHKYRLLYYADVRVTPSMLIMTGAEPLQATSQSTSRIRFHAPSCFGYVRVTQ